MIRACVIGWPISHSRSPLIHGHWLKQHGIDGAYEKKAVEPAHLREFLSDLSKAGYAGCNVTIPHKEAAFHCAKPDELAARLGAANTFYLRDGTLHATSTDGEGFIASLKDDADGMDLKGKSVLVLGAGGAARAIILALLDQGVERIDLANRTPGRAIELSRQFGARIKPLSWEQVPQAMENQSLLVNTTSLGMHGQPPLEISLDRLPSAAAVADIVYVPLNTPLLEQAAMRGHPTSGGLGMLLHQAVRGFELWFGTRPQVTASLRALVEADVRKTS
ncbi:MAG: shikimate dehydrogenase [Aestuariivirgaceae bacterium]|nr:shikimate dehydrogenase [Aestuariivirgaceae bacterium]